MLVFFHFMCRPITFITFPFSFRGRVDIMLQVLQIERMVQIQEIYTTNSSLPPHNDVDFNPIWSTNETAA
jgi:hypothetical protein